MTDVPVFGIYEELHHLRLEEILRRHPELRSVFGKLDPEEEPSRYTAFVARVLEQALREESASAVPKPLLVEISPPHALASRQQQVRFDGFEEIPRPLGIESDRPVSPNANPPRFDHHEVAPKLPFTKRPNGTKNLLIQSSGRYLVWEMRDQDAGMTPWWVRQDVRKAAVSGNQHRASLLGCPEDILVGVATQANVAHIESLMPCRAECHRQRSR